GADAGIKKAVDDGVIAGPRMRISVNMLSQTGGHSDGWLRSGLDLDLEWPGSPSGRVDGPDAVRRKVREMIRAGADVIKVATPVAPLGVLEAVDAGASLPASTIDKARAVVDVHQRNVARAIDAGVKVAMGTDSGVAPHGANLRELDRLVACGMSPQQALVA